MNKDEIRKLRTWLGLNRTDFGELIGVSWHAVQSWEQGKKIPQKPSRRLLSMEMAKFKKSWRYKNMVKK